MSKKAWVYIWSVVILAPVLTAVATLEPGRGEGDWLVFGALLVAATVAQLFEATHDKQSYYPHFVFFFASVILLNPVPLVVVLTFPHLVEWAKDRLKKVDFRKPWYIQPFNIAAHIIPAICAQWLYYYLLGSVEVLGALTPVVAAMLAVLVYVDLNHMLVGYALLLARNVTYAKSGIFSRESLLPDMVMSMLGYVLAVVWSLNPWLALPVLSPLVLMYQALKVPQLKQDAQTDSKTGLWNARHFAILYGAEVERAKRFARPLSLIMADLDLLRNINNTYGHMAGDTVLAGIGDILRENIREYDIAGRFGGEEFSLALPETGPEEAREIAERLREAVARAEFTVSTSPTPIQVTMSFGVASFPEDAFTANDLVHEADVAVYQAKLKGRNCVVCTVDVPHYVQMGVASVGDRLSSLNTPVFIPRPMPMRGNGTESGEPVATTVDRAVKTRHTAPLSLHTAPLQPLHAQDAHSPGTLLQEQAAADVAAANADTPMQAQVSNSSSSKFLPPYVTLVTLMGFAATIAGAFLGSGFDFVAIGLLTLLAMAVELLQIDAYGDNTVSVTVALTFAAALIAGVPGLAAVSLAIVMVHYLQKRPALYKTAFNWANHVLAGLAPIGALLISEALIPGARLDINHLALIALPLMAAAFLYFAVETGLIAVAIGLARGDNPLEIWRSQFRWLLGHYLVLSLQGIFLGIAYTALGTPGLVVFLLPVLMMRFAQKQYLDKTEDSVRELKRMNEQLQLANAEVVTAHGALHRFNEELFLTLSKIIDARDPFVGNHAAKVAEYASAIAEDLGIEPERIGPLRQAGFLHDIGKLGISEQILHKPSKLTFEEYEIVKTHAALGGEFLETSHGLRHLAGFVRHHHERWDGQGYPDKLAGVGIPLESRILAVCDSVEAMASDRPYRKGMSLAEVITEVKRCAGTQFDPAVADSFCRIAEREREQLVVNSAMTVLQRQAAERYARPGSTEAIPSEPALA